MRVGRYLVRRVAQLMPVLFVIVVLEFALIHLAPGDVARIMAGRTRIPPTMRFVVVQQPLQERVQPL